jgi:hypothetical protein
MSIFSPALPSKYPYFATTIYVSGVSERRLGEKNALKYKITP